MKPHEAGMLAELVDPTPTWDTIRELAWHDPVLRYLVHADECGYADRETLLIATVLFLARDRQRLMDAEIERRQREPTR